MSALLRRTSQLRKLYNASRRILRFPNINNLELLCTNPEVPQCAYGGNLVFQRNFAEIAAKFKNEEHSRVSDALPADEYIDRVLAKIDADAKRVGHVLKRDVESVFGRIKLSGTVSSIQALYLLRCCGSLLCHEPQAQRTEVLREIWDTLQELGVPMDASHYNALLKCYLENEHQFSPPEFLAGMERKGVTPNRVTYQRVIEKYCLDGDLTSASAILEHMKEKDFSINESIFNSLVLGHARAKDMQGAVNMLDVMRKSELEPTSDTYTSLACGFAENGDIESFSNTLQQAEEKQLYFSSKNYLQMTSSLAVSGNLDYIDEILMKVQIRQHRPETVNTGLSLINRGFEDAACRILLSLLSEGFQRTVYAFMKSLVAKGTAIDKMSSYCQQILNDKLYNQAYEDAAKAIILHSKAENAFEFFKEMKNVGRPIRCHYFWPILSAFSKSGNVEGIWETLKCMSDLALPADTDTFVDYILPHISTSGIETSEIISKVKELGQSDAVVVDALLIHYLSSSQMKAAADLCKDYDPYYNFVSIANSLTNINVEDVESAVMFLKQMMEKFPDTDFRVDVYEMILSRLMNRQNIPLFESFIKEFDIQGIKLATVSVEGLCMKLQNIAPALVRLVRNLEIDVIRDQRSDADFVRPSTLNLEDLEAHLLQLKETGGNLRPVLRHLLTHYCREKNLDRALEIKAELDSMDFSYSPAAYALLINLYVSFDKLDEATEYKKIIDAQYPHFKLDAAKGIDYVALMIKNDKVDEAFEIIRNEAKDWLPPRYDDLLLTSIKRLLHVAADTGSVELTQKLFEMFVKNLKFVRVHPVILEPLIKVHLIRNDSDAAIEEYRNCVANYSAYPSRNFLFKKFITTKDPERLQKVVDISTTYGGKSIPLHELAAAFIECGCVQEARKVFQTLGTRADMKQLDVICHRFGKQEKVMELEQFIGITKDLYNVDRDQLYGHLLNLYIQTNDFQAALEMWNSMQEENVQPGISTLQKLADLLEKNKQPVPFVVPSSSEFENVTSLMNSLNEKNEVEIINILKRMKKGEVHSLTPDTFTKIVDILVQKKCLREIVDMVQVMSCILAKPAEILKPVANKFGDAGDIDSIKLMYDCFPDFAHRYMHFNTNFFEAYLVSGQAEELMNELERNLATSRQLFSPGGFLKLLQIHPDLFERGIRLADMYHEKQGFDSPKMVVWLHYILQEKYEDADEYFKKNADTIVHTDYPFVRIIQAVRSTRNERLGRKLVDLANITLKSNFQSRAYSCFLDALVYKEKLEEAVALLEEANKNGVPTKKLLHPVLRNLKNSLIEKNMPVPFEISLEGGDSSSSSDSD